MSVEVFHLAVDGLDYQHKYSENAKLLCLYEVRFDECHAVAGVALKLLFSGLGLPVLSTLR